MSGTSTPDDIADIGDINPSPAAATVAQYVSLVTSEHNQQPNFIATISTTVQPFVDIQNTLLVMPSGYDVVTATGAQLDAVGLWVGLSRYVDTPLANTYFSWDVTGVGWDQGYWQGPFDPSQGVVRLSDGVYRFALYAKIAANSWNGTIAGAASALANIFNATETPGALLYIEDRQDMSMLYGVAGAIPGNIYLALLTEGYIPLVPGGIAVTYMQTTKSGSPCFGLDASGAYVAGLDQGAWAQNIQV